MQIQPVCNVSGASTATPKPQRTVVGCSSNKNVPAACAADCFEVSVGKQHAQLLGKRVHAVAVQKQPAQRRVNGRKTSCCITHSLTPSRCSCVYCSALFNTSAVLHLRSLASNCDVCEQKSQNAQPCTAPAAHYYEMTLFVLNTSTTRTPLCTLSAPQQ